MTVTSYAARLFASLMDAIRLRRFFELLLGGMVPGLRIGMELQGELPVRALHT